MKAIEPCARSYPCGPEGEIRVDDQVESAEQVRQRKERDVTIRMQFQSKFEGVRWGMFLISSCVGRFRLIVVLFREGWGLFRSCHTNRHR